MQCGPDHIIEAVGEGGRVGCNKNTSEKKDGEMSGETGGKKVGDVKGGGEKIKSPSERTAFTFENN